VPISDYTPSLADVGALLRDRTVDAGGNEVGTFTPTTRPTDVQAQILINQSANDAYLLFGEDIPDAPGNPASPTYDPNALRNAAKSAVEFHAAALIELSHFGEQVARGNSPYPQYEASWEAQSKRVQSAIESAGSSSPSGPAGGSMVPQFDFPDDWGGMVGWGTRW
jgi:hypothetical protein